MSKVCLRPVTLDIGHWTLDIGIGLVDPAGLKPAPNGLKVRCSVTRVPGQQIKFRVPSFKFQVQTSNLELETWNSKLIDLAVAEGFEPSHGRINSAVPYQLGYATECLGEGGSAKAKPFSISHFSFRTIAWGAVLK
jgi:hypothetical protein